MTDNTQETETAEAAATATDSSDNHDDDAVSCKILCRTLEALETRHQVEACVRTMTSDLQLSLQLQDQLEQDLVVNDLLQQLSQAQACLDEQSAVRREQRTHNRQLADQLVVELAQWSREHGQLQRVQQDYKALLEQHDQVVAKLLQMEMELEDTKQLTNMSNRRRSGGGLGSDADDPGVGDGLEDANNTVAGDGDLLLQEEDEAVSVVPSDSFAESLLQTATGVAPLQMPILETAKSVSEGSFAAADDQGLEPKPNDFGISPPQSPVRLQAPPESDAPAPEQDDSAGGTTRLQLDQLDQLDNKYLMAIFSYLDALDILNMAQTNVSMYSRIDTMFGMGGGDDNDSTIASNEDLIGSTSGEQKALISGETVSLTTAATTVSAGSEPTKAVTTHHPPQATIVSIPPPAPPAPVPAAAATSPTIASTPTRTTSKTDKATSFTTPTRDAAASLQSTGSFDGPRNIFASLLQPRKSPTSAATSSTSNTNANSKSNIMNAAMANSMGAKLSDAELNAIITMTKRLKEKEGLVESLQENVTQVTAKLEASEAVKQFLVTKCRDMEHSMAALQDHDAKVALQIASDQEVISFLDGRVLELESDLAQLQTRLDQSIATAQRVQEQADQKSMVMGDMLQYEREKLQESEREWKATKKLLIKEVKHCRAQVVSLQAERDGYREQNDRLKSAVLSSSSASPSSATHRSYTQAAVSTKGY